MNKNTLQKNKIKQRGFTLLFAVLVSTLVLSVGASVISIALKQIILSGSARDSQFAFYASNTGVECALYWDLIGLDDASSTPTFATSSESIFVEDSVISCGFTRDIKIDGDGGKDGIDVNPKDLIPDDNWNLETSSDSATTTFRVLLEDVSYCVDVSVSKYLDSDDKIRTTINSRGYNTCDENSKRRIERGLRIDY